MIHLKSPEILRISEPIVEITPDPEGGTVSMPQSIASKVMKQEGWIMVSGVKSEPHLSVGATPRDIDTRTSEVMAQEVEDFLEESERQFTPQKLLRGIWTEVIVPSSKPAIRQIRRAVANGASFVL